MHRPGFHNKFFDWADSLPEEMLGKPYSDQPSLAHLEPVNVATKPGDLLIWNRLRESQQRPADHVAATF